MFERADIAAPYTSPFCGGVIGYLSYDFGAALNDKQYEISESEKFKLPAANFGLYAWALITDHESCQTYLLFHPTVTEDNRDKIEKKFSTPSLESNSFKLTAPFSASQLYDEYKVKLESIQKHIKDGDTYQINYSIRFTAKYTGSTWSAYKKIREKCPTPFSAYISTDEGAISSHSPERFVSLINGQIETRPIKGTRPRNSEHQKDMRAIESLKSSEKDRSENLMIVDLLRNDIGKISVIGSVKVPELMVVETYPNVHHLVSSITGILRDDIGVSDLICATFPGGSITGAPKISAMQIINNLEGSPRSIYCGSILYIDSRGNMDSSITIRTLLLENGNVHCWGGGGIVAESVTHEEYEEILAKVGPLMNALASEL